MIEKTAEQQHQCQGEGCCSTTEDGSEICLVPQSNIEQETPPKQHKIRAGIMFAIGCITSPCCTPLILPAVLFLFAGTPIAIWLGQYIGWVFAFLTLVSVVSFVMGFYWMRQSNPAPKQKIRPMDIPILHTEAGDSHIVEARN